MSGPWEDYAPKTASAPEEKGPWSEYSQNTDGPKSFPEGGFAPEGIEQENPLETAQTLLKAGVAGIKKIAGVDPEAPGPLVGGKLNTIDTAANFIPTTPGQVALLAASEGAGAIGGPAGRAGVGAAMGYGLTGGWKGAAAGAAAGAMLPGTISKFTAETPLTEAQMKSVASAHELGLPTYLDEATNSPIARWIGDKLRSDPETAPQMMKADAERAAAYTKAKTDLLAGLGPGGTELSVGNAVQDEAGAKLKTQADKRLAEYRASRNDMAQQFPAPVNSEAKGQELVTGTQEEDAAMNSARGSLYKAVDALIPQDRSLLRVPIDETTTGDIKTAVDQAGLTRASKRTDVYRMGSDFLDGDPEIAAADKAISGLLDEKIAAWNGVKGHVSPQNLSILEAPGSNKMKLMPADFAEAFPYRGLEAERSAKGDMGVLADHPELASQLDPATQDALKNRGTMSLAQLDQHISNLKNSANSPSNSYMTASGVKYTPVGSKLLDMASSLDQQRTDFLQKNFPEAAQAKEEADLFHGDYSDTFQNDKIRSLFNSNPETVVQRIAKSGDWHAMKTLNNAVGLRGQPVVKNILLDMMLGDPAAIPSKADILRNSADISAAVRATFNPMEQAGIKAFAESNTDEAPRFLKSAYEKRLMSFANKQPDVIVNSMLAGNGDPMLARAVKAYTSPETFDRIGRMVGEKILTPDASAPEVGIAGIMNRVNGYDTKFLDTLYGDPAVTRRMKTIGMAANLPRGFSDLAKESPSSTPAISFGPNGAAISPNAILKAGGNLTNGLFADGMFLIKKADLLKMYQSPTGVQDLTAMIRMKPFDPRWPLILKRVAQGGYLQINAALNRRNSDTIPQP